MQTSPQEIESRIVKLEQQRPAPRPVLCRSAKLTAGVSAFIPVPNLRVTSSIVVSAYDPTGTDPATVAYGALLADRVSGSAGGFKISALKAGMLLNAAGTEEVDYIVVL